MQKADPEQIVQVLQRGASADHRPGAGASERQPVSKAVLLLLPEPLRDASREAPGGNAEFFAGDGAEDLRDAAAQAGRARRTGPPRLTGASTPWPTCSTASARRSPPICSRQSRRKTPHWRPPSATRCSRSRISSRFPKPGCANCSASVDKKTLATGAQGRVREVAEPLLQMHVFSRRRNAEGGHGSARAHRAPRKCSRRRAKSWPWRASWNPRAR